MIIRILLLAGLVSIGWFVFLRRNKMPFHIVTVFGLLLAGAVAVIAPETADNLAHFVGVGRGADFVMYVSIVAILFVLVHYYTKFVELQRNMTQLAREMAILRAELDNHGRAAAASTPQRPAESARAASDPS
jgi:hypothetical protein